MPENTPPKAISWSKVIITVLVIVLVAGLISGVLFWYFLVRQPTESTPATTNVATSSAKTASASAKKDETAGWLIYENKENAFSFKYPKSWYLNTNPATGFFAVVLSNQNSNYNCSSGKDCVIITFTAEQAGENSNTGPGYNIVQKLKVGESTTIQDSHGTLNYKRYSDIDISGYKASNYSQEYGGGYTAGCFQQVIVEKASMLYGMRLNSCYKNATTNQQDSFQRILATFKFL
jgi:hypothetical protein